MKTYLHVGGLVAVGFDASGEYLLTITHSGRGIFSTRTWKRIARDAAPAYPDNGTGIGIGPIDGQLIPVVEMNFDTEQMTLTSPDGRIILDCESSGIAVAVADAAFGSGNFFMDPQRRQEILRSPEFRTLCRDRDRVAAVLTLLTLAVYFGFIALVTFRPKDMSRDFGGLPLGIPLGVGVILLAWVFTALYVAWANRRYDGKVEAVRRRLQGDTHVPPPAI